jgi:hypothetical protein
MERCVRLVLLADHVIALARMASAIPVMIKVNSNALPAWLNLCEVDTIFITIPKRGA